MPKKRKSVKSQKEIKRLKAQGYITYDDFEAIGDGKTDDSDAIIAAHQFANEHRLPIKADSGDTYYIGGNSGTAIIETNTDFGSSKFIIDDRKVANRRNSIFKVASRLKSFDLEGISSLRKNQKKIEAELPMACVMQVTDESKNRYIRYGLNQNKGQTQTDIFLVDRYGNVDPKTPIIWDFDQISSIKAIPIDSAKLTITGGRFTTIANRAKPEYDYYGRNIQIERSNVTIDRLEHYIEGEKEAGAPYRGFISVMNAANVIVKNSMLTAHKMYNTIGNAGKPVSMGSYDISVNRALNVSFINCKQTNDINNREYWGIMASNYCKNILYDKCQLSRFDAHMGVYTATIRNSTLGYMGINAIGFGILTVENTKVQGRSFINLRQDYGSTWQGKFVIRNCEFVPTEGEDKEIYLINGFNSGQHDFGYTCYMPESIIIEDLYIYDSDGQKIEGNPAVFADFSDNKEKTTNPPKFPYITTKELILNDIRSHSGKPLRISGNPEMFRNIQVRGNAEYTRF